MNLPINFTQRMKEMLGEQFPGFLCAYENNPIYSAVRINTLKDGAKEAVTEKFNLSENVEWCKNGYYVNKEQISGNHPYHIGGLIYFQEPSAMSAVEALEINEGDFVLDLCAAPGGKSTQAAAKLKGTGLIVCNEIVRKRANILSGNIERLGIKNAIVTNEEPQKLAQKFGLFFDKIIVDAPCSGEGMFRKEPQAIDEWSIEHTLSCAQRQKNILDSAVEMLRPGGMIVYSTCTFAPCENEEIAEYLIKEKGLEICKINGLEMLDNGRTEWTKENTDVSYSKRIFPQNNKGEGHFVALFKKPGESGERIINQKNKKDKALEEAIKLYRDFEKKNLNIKIDGDFKLFGDMLYVLPFNTDIEKLKVLRYGIQLGECRKNRIEPSHSLARALKMTDFKNYVNLDCDSEELKKYLMGDVIKSDKEGFVAVCADNFTIGWGKASGGIIKNRLPKGLRIF